MILFDFQKLIYFQTYFSRIFLICTSGYIIFYMIHLSSIYSGIIKGQINYFYLQSKFRISSISPKEIPDHCLIMNTFLLA